MNIMHPPCTRDTPRCEYWEWERDYIRPACCTAHLRELLFFTHDLLTRHKIFHWLDYGSLLGAVRSQDLIPWDLDGDFGCWRADLAKILALETEIRAAGFWLEADKAPHLLRIQYSRVNLLHVDLFLSYVQNNSVKIAYVADAAEWSFPIQYLETLTTVTLCGKKFPAPSPPDSFLSEYRYGKNFMTPQQIPVLFWWNHVPSLRAEQNTPLLQTLLQELRAYDFRLAHLEKTMQAAPLASTTASPQPSLWFKLSALVPYALRKILWIALAYPFALHHWYAQKNPTPLALRELSPTIALLILELHRRERLLKSFQKKAGERISPAKTFHLQDVSPKRLYVQRPTSNFQLPDYNNPRSPRTYGIPNAAGAPKRLRIAAREPMINTITVNA